MILGKVCCGFFQELHLHAQFPVLALDLAQPGAVANAERWFLAGMFTAVSVDPITKGALVDVELLGYLGDRTRCLDHQFHSFFPIFRREASLRTRQSHALSRRPILYG